MMAANFVPLAPDFERLRRVLMLEGEPDRVPNAELHVDWQIKQAFLGRPIETVQDDVDFWYRAGYDYIYFPQLPRMNPGTVCGMIDKRPGGVFRKLVIITEKRLLFYIINSTDTVYRLKPLYSAYSRNSRKNGICRFFKQGFSCSFYYTFFHYCFREPPVHL